MGCGARVPHRSLGWAVIVLNRYAEALHDLTRDEFSELGVIQRAVCLAVRAETDCQKEYSVCFAELAGFQHIHFHIVPRATDLPGDMRSGGVFGYLKADAVILDRDAVVQCCERLRKSVARSLTG